MSSLLQANNIVKTFELDDEKPLTVLDEISFTVNHSEIFGIMGESGAGKSTLLNIIGTLDNPSSGEVSIDNTNIHELKEHKLCEFRNKFLAFVFQSFHLLPEFDVYENIVMPALISDKSKVDREYVNELLERVNLSNRKHYSITKLSGGEKQRVAIARALMNKPKIVFCDEPTGNLDHHNSENIFNLFSDISKELKTTFIVVSHSHMLKDYCDNFIYLEDGKILNSKVV